ncbi:MAG: acyl-CoA thioesterase [Rectinemataceae bacterium]|nr:acyl-CoA thioesterase [Rectinemataceae bacterium]
MTAQSPYLHKTQYYETDQMEERGIIVPVLAASCEYTSSVRYGETVAIIPRVEVYTGLRLTLSYRILDARSGELRARGETRHAFLDRDFRPSLLKRHHPDVDKLMKTLLVSESNT